jgi:hypothetical protein
MADHLRGGDPAHEGGAWHLEEGTAERRPRGGAIRADGPERLTYSNPVGLEGERVWFDGRIVCAVEQRELDLNLSRVKVAQECLVVYAVVLDERGKLKDGAEPERVSGPYNLHDSVSGTEQYSPPWQFNFVVMPRACVANGLRSEADCLGREFRVVKSTRVEN